MGFSASEFAQKKAEELRATIEQQRQEEEKQSEVEPTTEEETEPLVEYSMDDESSDEVEPEQPIEDDKSVSSLEEAQKQIQAMKKELARVKADRREGKVGLGDIVPTVEDTEEQATVTKAEARLFTAWRSEALEELIEKNPQYKTDPTLWKRFELEYQDRIDDLEYARRHNIPVTKGFFKERLQRVHKAISDDSVKAKEEGKKELLKAQSAASIMGVGANKNQVNVEPKKSEPKPLFPKTSNSFDSWLTKK